MKKEINITGFVDTDKKELEEQFRAVTVAEVIKAMFSRN